MIIDYRQQVKVIRLLIQRTFYNITNICIKCTYLGQTPVRPLYALHTPYIRRVHRGVHRPVRPLYALHTPYIRLKYALVSVRRGVYIQALYTPVGPVYALYPLYIRLPRVNGVVCIRRIECVCPITYHITYVRLKYALDTPQ